ncbi:hypothetical protein [Amycolatopsis sp. NPDC004378]
MAALSCAAPLVVTPAPAFAGTSVIVTSDAKHTKQQAEDDALSKARRFCEPKLPKKYDLATYESSSGFIATLKGECG